MSPHANMAKRSSTRPPLPCQSESMCGVFSKGQIMP